MTDEQRISNIDLYVKRQRIVEGHQFTIIPAGDGFIIEFTRASKRQMITLNRTFVDDGMNHLHARAKELLLVDPAKKKRKRL
ncbi:MAG: hypothetical protein QM762_12485 [Chryseolinea sp.]